jgi:small nuclear ribonucleoprotein (snRNP)-like protein
MKRIVLIVVSIIAIYTITYAQTITNATQLKNKALQLSQNQKANYTKALQLAKTKHWDLIITSTNGNKAYLVGLTPNGLPKYYTTFNNTIAAATTRASQLWVGGASGLNLSGASANITNKLAIWDGGKVLQTHKELVGRITQKDSTTGIIDHATHVTGTLMASGVNAVAKGMAYGLQGILAYDFFNDISEISSEAPNIIVSNHSYGVIAGWVYNGSPSDGSAARWEFWGRPNENEDVNFGYYDEDTKSLDDIAYNAPYYLYVKAAGNNRNQNGPAVGSPYYRYNANDSMVAAGNRPASLSSNNGYDILPTYANSKNTLIVGAVKGIANGYTQPSDVVMSSFSSWGPTDDGRIKPDIVADGVSVTSCVAANDSAYATYSGTSMASPNAAGSLLLLQEYYAQIKAGAFMRSATLKGLAIHTAEEAGDTTGPDYRFGWGLLNVEKCAAVIKAAITNNNSTSSEHLLYENVLANGDTFTKTIIANGNSPLVATICWTDVSGSVTPYANALNDRTIKLVNDLDIRITKNGITYYPWILDPANPAAPATKGDNIRDNVERINIDSAKAGDTYTITISHKGILTNGSQAYSLLLSGVGGTANLPVNLLAFTAKQQGNAVQLNWQTANEVNAAYFIIERSVDGVTFTALGKVSAKGDGSYSFTDNLASVNLQSTTIYYRLQIVDKDGSFTYSKIAAITINTITNTLSIYPNPVTNTMQVRLTNNTTATATLQITDMQGKVLQQQAISLQAGANTITVNTTTLAKGNYIVVIHAEEVYKKVMVKE